VEVAAKRRPCTSSATAPNGALLVPGDGWRRGNLCCNEAKLRAQRRDEVWRIAKGDAVLRSKALGAFGDQHHVRAFFENGAGQADGILDAVQNQRRNRREEWPRPSTDRIAFDLTVEIEMRAIAGVEDGIVFKNDDGGFKWRRGVAASGEDVPADLQGAAAPSLAGFDGVIGNVQAPPWTMRDGSMNSEDCRGEKNLSSWGELRHTEKRALDLEIRAPLKYPGGEPTFPHSYPCSIIGPARLNFRVVRGIGKRGCF